MNRWAAPQSLSGTHDHYPAWVRKLRDCNELLVVSDSRLNGGSKMGCGQKVICLPRSDAFICFVGDTTWAYPLMHQAANAIATYEKSATRALDITALKSHVLKVFEGLRAAAHQRDSMHRQSSLLSKVDL